jgi:metal-responsive CopG/Arc/MetJ family transcriptional regulator
MKEIRICVRLDQEQQQKIEAFIKREYPKVKTVSQVIRAALHSFLKEAD